MGLGVSVVGQLSGKSVLVTGATGFIGANLVRSFLNRGLSVIVLTRNGSSTVRLASVRPQIELKTIHPEDVMQLKNILCDVAPDFIVHSAFGSGYPKTPEAKNEMLVSGTTSLLNILDAAMVAGIKRFVLLGSSTEYGRSDHPFMETDPLNPIMFRGGVKAASTLLSRQFAVEHQFPLIVLRLFSIFGPMESPQRFIPNINLSILRGVPFSLTPPGIVHDYLHVEDVSRACLAAFSTELAPGEIINIGSGHQVANEKVVELMEHITGKHLDILENPFPVRLQDLTCWQADIQKAGKVLNWKPTLSLMDGLTLNWTWWQEHWTHPEGPF